MPPVHYGEFMRFFERLFNWFPFPNYVRKPIYGCTVETGFSYNGKRPHFHESCAIAGNVYVDNEGELTIGKNVVLAHGVRIHTHTHHFGGIMKGHPRDKRFKEEHILKKIDIGDNVFIGENSLIFKSVPKNTFIPAGTIWR